MKILVVVLALSLGTCIAGEVASIEGDWIPAASDEEIWRAYAMANPKTANNLTGGEKKQMIALGRGFQQACCWSFKKDGTFEVRTTISKQLLADALALQSKMDQTSELKAQIDKIKADVPAIQFRGDWKQKDNKISVAPKSENEQESIAPSFGEITKEGLKLEGALLVRKKKD